jgi:hypothetical protein
MTIGARPTTADLLRENTLLRATLALLYEESQVVVATWEEHAGVDHDLNTAIANLSDMLETALPLFPCRWCRSGCTG